MRADALTAAVEEAVLGPSIRIINYHDVPPGWARHFETQLAYFKDRFEPATISDLREVLAGHRRSTRPGLIITFDDGLRSHAEVAAPLLEKYGFTGWFFVPPAFLSCPVEDQQSFARASAIIHFEREPRVAMTWDQARQLATRHTVGCHSLTHVRLASSLGEERLASEIVGSKTVLERELDMPVSSFCWVGGEEWAYSREAARYICEAGYDWALMTNTLPAWRRTDPLQLQRTNVEAWDPSEVVRFQLSGLMDVYYAAKRRRINELTRF